MGYQYFRAIPVARTWGYVRAPPGEGPVPRRYETKRGTRKMSLLKFYVQRATMFLGAMAAFGFVIDGAKRW